MPTIPRKRLDEITNGKISHRKAERKYKIPRRKIFNKLKGKHSKKSGKQPVLNSNEEKQFENCIISMGEFGDILCSIKPPTKVSNRGFFSIPELDRWWQFRQIHFLHYCTLFYYLFYIFIKFQNVRFCFVINISLNKFCFQFF